MITIIPAIDLINGKCVRLLQGDYTKQKTYNENPVAMAQQFEQTGLKRLHIVDLDGAKVGHLVNHKTVENIAKQTNLMIDVGGGIRTNEDIQMLFDYGASIVSIGSIAYKSPELFNSWIKAFGTERILLNADVKQEQIFINGWMDKTNISVFDFIQSKTAQGIENICCTDIEVDGTLGSPSVELYKKIIHRFPDINLVASGGVSSVNDIEALQAIGCKGVIIGKAIYEAYITLEELSAFIKQQENRC